MNTVVKVNRIRSYQTLVYKNGNRTHRTQEYKSYIQEVGLQLGRLKAVKGKFEVKIIFYSNDARVGDLDNITKPIMDILQMRGKIKNDRLCEHMFLRKIIDKSLKLSEIHIELRALE